MRRWLKKRDRDGRGRYSTAVEELLSAPEADLHVADPLPWKPARSGSERVLLVPAADYHLDELVPLSVELGARGLETIFAVGESPWARTKRGLARYPDLPIHWLPAPDALPGDVRLVVTLKDTGSMTEWVTAVRALGIPVIGKVEGAQDFWDSDTPEERRPYRNFDLVLCQGRFDAEALSNVETAIVGSSRLERLWWAPAVEPPETPLALINLNFVYGVRTQDRKLWLDSAVRACKEADIPYLISVHPAERTQMGPNMTRVSALSLLPHSSGLISRFSTVPLEALAMGVPFIYHNPHGERVPTFAAPFGAFETTRSSEDLASLVAEAASSRQRDRMESTSFFSHHVSVSEEASSEQRSAQAVMNCGPTGDETWSS